VRLNRPRRRIWIVKSTRACIHSLFSGDGVLANPNPNLLRRSRATRRTCERCNSGGDGGPTPENRRRRSRVTDTTGQKSHRVYEPNATNANRSAIQKKNGQFIFTDTHNGKRMVSVVGGGCDPGHPFYDTLDHDTRPSRTDLDSTRNGMWCSALSPRNMRSLVEASVDSRPVDTKSSRHCRRRYLPSTAVVEREPEMMVPGRVVGPEIPQSAPGQRNTIRTLR
jgi:hypothetical protein